MVTAPAARASAGIVLGILLTTAAPAGAQGTSELRLAGLEPEAPLPGGVVRLHLQLHNHSRQSWNAGDPVAYRWAGGDEGRRPLGERVPPGARVTRTLVLPTPSNPGATTLTVRLPEADGAPLEVPVSLQGFYVDGRGNGHGLGMSQWGARGRAESGQDYRAILASYYQGARLDKRDTSLAVRVKLHHGVIDLGPGWPALLGRGPRVWGPAQVAGAGALGPDDFVEWFVRSGQLATRVVRAGVEAAVADATSLEITATDAATGVRTNLHQAMAFSYQPLGEERRYRGALRVVPVGGTSYQVINVVPFEEYLKGVVPSEMPTFWHPEALRAQAVAARTYALRKVQSGGQGASDLEATEFDQVYGGITVERRASTEAVEATRGEVLTSGGGLVDALFMSSGGGRTEDSENGFVRWNGQVIHAAVIPYLRGVADPMDPYPGWRVGPYTAEQAATLLRDRGFDIGQRLQRVELLDRGPSGRVLAARLVGDGGSRTVSGPTLRYALGLRDTLVEVHGP